MLFERLAIEVLKEANIEGAARLLRVSWDEAWNLMERAVRRGQWRKKRLKTARAWAIKESFRELWDYQSLSWAGKHFKSWYAWAIRSRLNSIKQVARMFRKYLRNILTYLKHRITNAVSEGINSTIQTIKKMACGFRNREHFKIAIYSHCGGLNLYPDTH